MIRTRAAMALMFSLLMASSYSLKADVRADQKGRVEFGGMLGKVVNIFGGKGAREGIASTVAVKGDRKATLSEATGQIIDIGEEKIYDLDMKHKTYKVITFEELRRRMEEARKKAEENARKEQGKASEPAAPNKNEKQMEIDFSLKETGQKKTINGYDTHEVVMTITMREKGKTLEESGGLVLTSDIWMGPKIAAMKEIPEFDQRYWRKLQGPAVAGASAEDMAAAMALYPGMKDAIARMNTENVKLDGTAIQTTTTIDAVKSAADMAAAQQSGEEAKPAPPSGLGGMLGGFAKKKMEKKSEGDANANSNRSTFMTTTSEVIKVTTDVAAADVAIPAGFKESR
jgi:hypothetical protein